MTLEAVVFDLFHTLVDPEDFRPGSFSRTQKISDIFGLSADEFSRFWAETYRARDVSEQSPLQWIKSYLNQREVSASKGDLEKADDILGRYQDEAIDNPRGEILEALQLLQKMGLKIGLLSNADGREIRRWPYSPLSLYFDVACFSCEIGSVKPEGGAYETVLDKLNISARNAVFVGDGGSSELEGAKKAGFGLVVLYEGFIARNGLRSDQKIRNLRQTADEVARAPDEIIAVVERVKCD